MYVYVYTHIYIYRSSARSILAICERVYETSMTCGRPPPFKVKSLNPRLARSHVCCYFYGELVKPLNMHFAI